MAAFMNQSRQAVGTAMIKTKSSRGQSWLACRGRDDNLLKMLRKRLR
jgi:hypothetical protein